MYGSPRPLLNKLNGNRYIVEYFIQSNIRLVQKSNNYIYHVRLTFIIY